MVLNSALPLIYLIGIYISVAVHLFVIRHDLRGLVSFINLIKGGGVDWQRSCVLMPIWNFLMCSYGTVWRKVSDVMTPR